MLRNYVKLALKVLLRRKFFTFISLFGISVTLVVLVIVAALYDGVFGAAPPETRHERTLCVTRASMSGEPGRRMGGPGYALLDQTIRHLPGAEASSIMTSATPVTTHTPTGKVSTFLKRTDGAYWQILDFEFVEGAAFREEDSRSAASVAVINESTRDRFFGGDGALGKTIRVGELSCRVVGVVRNVPFDRQIAFSDVWVPIGTETSTAFRQELVGSCIGIVLARDRADGERLKDEFQSRLRSVVVTDRQFPHLVSHLDDSAQAMARMITMSETEDGGLGLIVAVLTGFGLLFMVLPALNLVNINVSRIMERASEIGVRKAFGASSASLVGQFVVENLVVTLVGGAVALLLSFALLEALNRSGMIPYANYHINGRVFLIALATTLFFGVVSGVYPAWRMSRLNPVQALKGGAR